MQAGTGAVRGTFGERVVTFRAVRGWDRADVQETIKNREIPGTCPQGLEKMLDVADLALGTPVYCRRRQVKHLIPGLMPTPRQPFDHSERLARKADKNQMQGGAESMVPDK